MSIKTRLMMRSSQSFFHFLLPCLLLPVSIGCSRSVESLEKLQTQMLEDIVKQGGNSLKSVVCSPKEGEQTLQCLGVLASGSGVDIEVKQKEDQSYEWNIPSIKGLLNMLQVQTAIQAELRQDLGETTLNCGGDQKYKAVQPGDAFDCQLTITQPALITQKPAAKAAKAAPAAQSSNVVSKDEASAKPAASPKKITITILSNGDVNWQKVVPEDKKAVKTGNDGSAMTKTSDAQAENDPSTKPPAAFPGSPISPPAEANPVNPTAAQSADDFLNQAGATDNFE